MESCIAWLVAGENGNTQPIEKDETRRVDAVKKAGVEKEAAITIRLVDVHNTLVHAVAPLFKSPNRRVGKRSVAYLGLFVSAS